MKQYKYRVEDASGITIKGMVLANSKSDAVSRLPPHKRMISLEDKGTVVELPKALQKYIKPQKIKKKELAEVFNQLSFMLAAGMTMSNAILNLAVSGADLTRKLANGLYEVTGRGGSLADGFKSMEAMLPGDYSFIIRSGQMAGTLDTTLARLSERLDSEVSTVGKVKSAMVYPVMVIVLVFGVSIFMFTTIIPQLAGVLREIGNAELPALTLFLLSISDSLISYWWLHIIVGVTLLVTIRHLVKTVLAYQVAYYSMRVPLFGKIIRVSQMTMFYTNLTFMLGSGSSNTEAFSTSMATITNAYIKKQLEMAYKEVVNGKSYTQALSMTSVVSAIEISTIDIGLTTGHLEELLTTLVEKMNRDMDSLIKALLSAMDPILLIILGLFVGVIIIAVYGPLFSMASM